VSDFDRIKKMLRQHDMTLTRRPGGEYRVNFKGGSEESAYYTTELSDAYGTALAMRKQRSMRYNPTGRYHTRGNPKHPKRARTNPAMRFAKGGVSKDVGRKPRLYPFYVVGFRTFSTKRPAVSYAKRTNQSVVTINNAADRERYSREFDWRRNPKTKATKRNPVPMFPIYVKRRESQPWNMVGVARTKEYGRAIAHALRAAGYWVRVTDGKPVT